MMTTACARPKTELSRSIVPVRAVTRPPGPLGPHRILCGDALKMPSFGTLMSEGLAKVTFADPPYNVPVSGFVSHRTS